MAFKLIVLSAVLAVASAGGPAAYSIATASGDYGSVGYTQESTHKGYLGQNVVSSFSKQVDSPHSTVRVSNNRVTNDALYSHTVAAAPAAYTTYAHQAPTVLATKSAYAVAPSYGYAHAAPAYGYAHSAPAVAYSSAPAVSYSSISTPVIAKSAYAHAPAYGYAAAPAAPLITKTAYAHAPAYGYAAAPAAPLIAKTAYAHAPAYGYAAAPAAYGYAGTGVAHTTFEGLGAHYAW
ncbi:cuticle protein 16.5 [Athalia rosae]|uniref:cuticle protein 16.5 n=1 Tax=Athalia rosae TaxID=37344 RepID=UPI000DE7F660|nr:cuticle protein 16.5 [Athalia rosae]